MESGKVISINPVADVISQANRLEIAGEIETIFVLMRLKSGGIALRFAGNGPQQSVYELVGMLEAAKQRLAQTQVTTKTVQ